MADYPEPTWGESQNVFCEPSAMLKMGPSATRITGFLVRAIQVHFYTPANIQDEVLRSALWSKDTEEQPLENKILIGAARAYSVKDIAQRPAVLVKPGAVTCSRLALMDRGTAGLRSDGSIEGVPFIRKINGQHTARALAKGEMAAHRLGEEVFQRLLMASPLMCADMYVGDFQVLGMSAPQEIEGASQCYGVDIGMSWGFMFQWNLEQITPIFEKMVVRA